ncbi:MAG: cation diffusion facilitator family transporter [Verrucomicrobiota bacterium]
MSNNNIRINSDDNSFTVISVGLIGNGILCSVKIAAGIVGNSQAVVADGIHSVSDIATDIALLVGARYWRKPPDSDHPYGHGRLEMLVTLGLALVLAGAGVGLTIRSLATLQAGENIVPGWIAAGAAFVSLVSKEIMFRWTLTRGKAINSPAIKANAWHHRSDAFTSVPALLAVVGARLMPHWWFLDAVGAVVVAAMIFRAAWAIGGDAFQSLMDRSASDKVIGDIQRTACEIEGVEAVHAVRTRNVGRGWSVDLHVLVPGDLSVRRGHEIAEKVQQYLLTDHKNIIDVVVHIEPLDDAF